MNVQPQTGSSAETPVDALIVGAGFAGLYALHRLRRSGLRVRILEAGDGVGGTWYWNCYPGARCDVPSLEYSYSFSDDLQQEWSWSERYAAQPEIECYLNHVADRFDLRRDIELGQRVVRAEYRNEAQRWVLETSTGRQWQASYLVAAVGGYSAPVMPDMDGINDFERELYHTALWPGHEVDFAGKRVGVLGTGSSGMQVITEVAKRGCAHLYVFQRTANFCVPANNRPMAPDYEAEFKRNYAHLREISRNSAFGVGYPVGEGRTTDLSDEEFMARIERAVEYGGPALLSAFPDFLVDEAANDRVAEYLRSEVRRRVDDPVVAELLCAKTHYVGARRLLVEDGYLETYNRPDVSLVDISSAPIQHIMATSVVTAEAEYELDLLVLATGFDSGSGAMLRLNPIGGRNGALSRHWATGPKTFLGVMSTGFPNMFMLYAPGSPGIRGQGALMAEIQTDWVADLIDYARARGVAEIEPLADAEDDWTRHVAEVAEAGLSMRNDTTYVGANIPGKPRVYAAYLGGVGFYRRFCERLAAEGYPGLELRTRDGQRHTAATFEAPPLSAIRVSAI